MMSEYYSEEDLIKVLSNHIPSIEFNTIFNSIDWKAVIEDGEIYNGVIEGTSNPYIYSVPMLDGELTVFVHPMICTEVYFDAWTDKEAYMGRKEGEIW